MYFHSLPMIMIITLITSKNQASILDSKSKGLRVHTIAFANVARSMEGCPIFKTG